MLVASPDAAAVVADDVVVSRLSESVLDVSVLERLGLAAALVSADRLRVSDVAVSLRRDSVLAAPVLSFLDDVLVLVDELAVVD